MSLLLDHSQTAPLEAVHLEMDQVENTLRDKSALLASICLQVYACIRERIQTARIDVHRFERKSVPG